MQTKGEVGRPKTSCEAPPPPSNFIAGRPEAALLPPHPPPPPRRSNFIAGRPKAALLLWFFGHFRYGALLFMVILVIYQYKNRLK